MANDESELDQLALEFEENLVASLDDSSELKASARESSLLYHSVDDDSELSEEDEEEDQRQSWYSDTLGQISAELNGSNNSATSSVNHKVSIVDGLLCEIYNRKVSQNDDQKYPDSHPDHAKGRTTSFLGDAKLTEEILKTKSKTIYLT